MFRKSHFLKSLAIPFISILLLSSLTGCKDKTTDKVRVTHDFTKEFYRSNLNLVLDFMSFDDSIRPCLGEGWSIVEKYDEKDSFIWSEGDKSVLNFYVIDKKDLNAVIKCKPLPAGKRRQSIDIEVNGVHIQKLSLNKGIESYNFTVPGKCLMFGLNRMTFTYAYNLTPKSLGINIDERKLGVRFYSIDLDESLDNYIFLNGVGGTNIRKNVMNMSRMSIDGDMKLVLMQMPKSGIVFDKCYIPPNSELRFSLGFHPEVLDWTEDVTFSVFAEEYTPYKDKIQEEIFSATLNPKMNEEDRSWRDYRIDLSDYSGKVLSFSFVVLANADPNNIICAWGEPKIYSRVEEPKYNIIFITMDALRRDHVTCYGYEKETTPNIDKFAKDAVKFNDFCTVATWTFPSFCSFYTSLFVQTHGAKKNTFNCIDISSFDLLGKNIPTLPIFLKPYGYTTHVLTKNSFLCEKKFRVTKDFDRISDDTLNVEKPFFLDEIAKLLTDYIDERFFLHIHIMPPHDPYYAVSPYDKDIDYDDFWKYNPFKLFFSSLNKKSIVLEKSGNLEKKEHIVNLYDTGLMLSDEFFGELVDIIKEKGLYDDSLIIFSSDHGEQFWEHGGMFHTAIHNEILEVPLLIKYPEDLKVPLDEVNDPFLSIDILPTILEVNGIPRPVYLQGRSLLRLKGSSDNMDKREHLFFSNATPDGIVSLIYKDYKYICNPEEGTEELYNIIEDPREQNDIASIKPEIVEKLRAALSNYEEIVKRESGYKTVENPDEDVLIPENEEDEAESPETDKETLERLRDLGYVE